ncbi:hypothetical protein TCAL_00459 [Tigriopus californicus]|uniref:RNA polymerase II subunit A C-terminal domain phosphatase SSU72 n=1 Tax=Tigriopus californicus TaxID=6832 RepID=A0A553NFX1_TIGCA|nr:RNA polymerase II subunit A C-terminal domain phosphatase SSU72-like [Tigriopus californicus]TRY64346.1 hypothetical protein TCAL_00459 [Tigriopus californicus]
MSKLRIAVVCSSNMNRSMEAHAALAKKQYDVKSYGTGKMVRIPGPTRNEPNAYEFGTTYEAIYEDLKKKDRKLYTETGMLHILDRNRRIKAQPERFQEVFNTEKFDIILTVEERVYDNVITAFEERDSLHEQPVHIINMDVVDNPEDATIGAFLLCDLVRMLDQSDDLDDDIDEIVQEFEAQCKRAILHTVSFY